MFFSEICKLIVLGAVHPASDGESQHVLLGVSVAVR